MKPQLNQSIPIQTIKDATLMLRCLNGAINIGLPVKKGSPCHKRLKAILRKLGHDPKQP